MRAPIPESYWVEPGRLLAGRYPRPEEVERLLEAGVTTFLDLTEPGEVAGYQRLLGARARAVRLAVRDFSCPSREQMTRILDVLDAELEAGRVVYVHCRGGRGRTGTIVGCHLVRRGLAGRDALARVAELRRGIPTPSPETRRQKALVRRWREDELPGLDSNQQPSG